MPCFVCHSPRSAKPLMRSYRVCNTSGRLLELRFSTACQPGHALFGRLKLTGVQCPIRTKGQQPYTGRYNCNQKFSELLLTKHRPDEPLATTGVANLCVLKSDTSLDDLVLNCQVIFLREKLGINPGGQKVCVLLGPSLRRRPPPVQIADVKQTPPAEIGSFRLLLVNNCGLSWCPDDRPGQIECAMGVGFHPTVKHPQAFAHLLRTSDGPLTNGQL